MAKNKISSEDFTELLEEDVTETETKTTGRKNSKTGGNFGAQKTEKICEFLDSTADKLKEVIRHPISTAIVQGQVKDAICTARSEAKKLILRLRKK